MYYDPKVVKFKRSKVKSVPSQKELLKIMDEVKDYEYIAICDYLEEVIKRGEEIDIDAFIKKHYSHPVNVSKQAHYLTSYFFLAFYLYTHDLYPLTAIDYLHIALLDEFAYDSASALLALCYIQGFGVKKSTNKSKEIIMRAREEINSWPYRYDISPLSVFKLEI